MYTAKSSIKFKTERQWVALAYEYRLTSVLGM